MRQNREKPLLPSSSPLISLDTEPPDLAGATTKNFSSICPDQPADPAGRQVPDRPNWPATLLLSLALRFFPPRPLLVWEPW